MRQAFIGGVFIGGAHRVFRQSTGADSPTHPEPSLTRYERRPLRLRLPGNGSLQYQAMNSWRLDGCDDSRVCVRLRGVSFGIGRPCSPKFTRFTPVSARLLRSRALVVLGGKNARDCWVTVGSLQSVEPGRDELGIIIEPFPGDRVAVALKPSVLMNPLALHQRIDADAR